MHASMILAPLFAALVMGAAVPKALDTDFAKMPGAAAGSHAALAAGGKNVAL